MMKESSKKSFKDQKISQSKRRFYLLNSAFFSRNGKEGSEKLLNYVKWNENSWKFSTIFLHSQSFHLWKEIYKTIFIFPQLFLFLFSYLITWKLLLLLKSSKNPSRYSKNSTDVDSSWRNIILLNAW